MSPTDTSQLPDLLEHPAEAFSYYRHQGIAQVVCEQKHMGSRAVVVVCRDEDSARQRFGVVGDGSGICYTRTGRRFFDDKALEIQFISTIKAAISDAGLWDEFNTDWFCLDCELMPWSAKAQELLRQQYAAVGAASRVSLAQAVTALEQGANRVDDVGPLLDRYRAREEAARQYTDAYRRYCWPVNSIADLKLAPFHLLATEGKVHTDKNHIWHMKTLKRACGAGDGLLFATSHIRRVRKPASDGGKN
jgi:protein phosphatase